jgi:hypothetical protein
MNKLFLLLLAFTSTMVIEAEVKEIDRDANVRVICVQNHVFIRDRDGGITQFMRWDEFHLAIRPVKCTEYEGII